MKKKEKLYLQGWIKSVRGATAIEYGMIIAGIAAALAAVVFSMGDSLVTIFQSIVTRIESVL